jgi:hypothetical protein
VSLPFVSFRYTYNFLADGTMITSDSTLRFRNRTAQRPRQGGDDPHPVRLEHIPERRSEERIAVAIAAQFRALHRAVEGQTRRFHPYAAPRVAGQQAYVPERCHVTQDEQDAALVSRG